MSTYVPHMWKPVEALVSVESASARSTGLLLAGYDSEGVRLTSEPKGCAGAELVVAAGDGVAARRQIGELAVKVDVFEHAPCAREDNRRGCLVVKANEAKVGGGAYQVYHLAPEPRLLHKQPTKDRYQYCRPQPGYP